MPRKTHQEVVVVLASGVHASMRPRPDAAENMLIPQPPFLSRGRFNEAAARCRGKRAQVEGGAPEGRLASMRPRPDAAENAVAAAGAGRAGSPLQ